MDDTLEIICAFSASERLDTCYYASCIHLSLYTQRTHAVPAQAVLSLIVLLAASISTASDRPPLEAQIKRRS